MFGFCILSYIGKIEFFAFLNFELGSYKFIVFKAHKMWKSHDEVLVEYLLLCSRNIVFHICQNSFMHTIFGFGVKISKECIVDSDEMSLIGH